MSATILLRVLCGVPTRQRGRVQPCPSPLGHVEPRLTGPLLVSSRLDLGGQPVIGVVQLGKAEQMPDGFALVCPRHGPLAVDPAALRDAADDPKTRTFLLIREAASMP